MAFFHRGMHHVMGFLLTRGGIGPYPFLDTRLWTAWSIWFPLPGNLAVNFLFVCAGFWWCVAPSSANLSGLAAWIRPLDPAESYRQGWEGENCWRRQREWPVLVQGLAWPAVTGVWPRLVAVFGGKRTLEWLTFKVFYEHRLKGPLSIGLQRVISSTLFLKNMANSLPIW